MTHLATIPLSGGALVDLDMTVLIQLAIFLVMFVVLRSLLFKPTLKLIEARHEATIGARNQSEKLEQKATELNTEFERQMLDIRATAAAERIRLVEGARSKAGDIVDNARKECHELSEEAERDTAAKIDEVHTALVAEITTLAGQTASSVLGRDLGGNL